MSNEKQIYTAFQLYLADSGGVYPKGYNLYRLNDGGWVDSIATLSTSSAIFECPSDSHWAMREVMATNGGRALPSSYVVNERVLTKIRVEPVHQTASIFRGTIANPTGTILLCDDAEQAYGKAPYIVSCPGTGEITFDQFFGGNVLRDPQGATQCGANCNNVYAPSARHNGRANVLFFDGHIKSMENSKWYFSNTPYLDPARGG